MRFPGDEYSPGFFYLGTGFMEKNVLFIKNMVCARCILSVSEILSRLEIPYDQITLGEVSLSRSLSLQEKQELAKELDTIGFEIIEDKNTRLVNRIKSVIIKGIYEDKNFSNQNLSAILSEELNFDYSHLSNLFSRIEGKSIQHYQQDIKTERVKELLEYDQLSISEIAMDLGYSSAAYLSTQFKKSTGLTPSQYKIGLGKKRNSLDSH
ncbi:helix-turn-helix domain-containing protein [Antarcticibacterium arcticum]|nr:AraC family transcriptional regulator [Antarcticibacterium arcticum]